MNLISLNDYAADFLGGGFGSEELVKAMQAGQITGRETANQSLTMEPLKIEALDTTLKILEARMKDIKLFNLVPKLTAYNTVEEFLQLESYGNEIGGFYNEGELSDVEDSKYVRRAELVKYLQITGEVTLQAQMVRSYVDAMRQETENKTMWILKRANRALTQANSSLIPQEWNSFYAQHASVGSGDGFLYPTLDAYYNSSVVIDLRGKSLKQVHVEEGAIRVDANFGNVSHLCAPTAVLSCLSRDYFKDQRIMLNASSAGAYSGAIGTVAKQIDTTIGSVELVADKFMVQSRPRKLSDQAIGDKAPAAVTSVSATLQTDANTKYGTGEYGDVFYAVAAKNGKGESPLTQIGSGAVTLAAGKAVDLSFTPGTGNYSPTCYVVYRTKVTTAGSATGLDFYPIFTVSTAERSSGYDGATAAVVRDRGRILPDTETAFLTEVVEEVLAFKQLAPISKLDLAILGPSRRFLTFMFGTPQLYTPKKMVKFINVSTQLTTES